MNTTFSSLPFSAVSFSPAVQEEVDTGSFLLPVRAGHPGKHYIWSKRPFEEP